MFSGFEHVDYFYQYSFRKIQKRLVEATPPHPLGKIPDYFWLFLMKASLRYIGAGWPSPLPNTNFLEGSRLSRRPRFVI